MSIFHHRKDYRKNKIPKIMENKIQEVVVIDEGDDTDIKKSKSLKVKKKIKITSKRRVVLSSGPESTENLIITQKVKLKKEKIKIFHGNKEKKADIRHSYRRRHTRDRDHKEHKRITIDKTCCDSKVKCRKPSLLTSLKERPTPTCLRKRCTYESIQRQLLCSDRNKKKSSRCYSKNSYDIDLSYEDITSDSFLSSDEEQIDTLIKRAKQRELESRFRKDLQKCLMVPKQLPKKEESQTQLSSDAETLVLKSPSLSPISTFTLESSEDKNYLSPSPIYFMISPIHVKLADTQIQSGIDSDTDSSIHDHIQGKKSFKDILSEKIVSYSEMEIGIFENGNGVAYSPIDSPDEFLEGQEECKYFVKEELDELVPHLGSIELPLSITTDINRGKEINDCQIKQEIEPDINFQNENVCTIKCEIDADDDFTKENECDLNSNKIVNNNYNDIERRYSLSESVVLYSEAVTDLLENRNMTDIKTEIPDRLIENAVQLMNCRSLVGTEKLHDLIPDTLIENAVQLINYYPLVKREKLEI